MNVFVKRVVPSRKVFWVFLGVFCIYSARIAQAQSNPTSISVNWENLFESLARFNGQCPPPREILEEEDFRQLPIPILMQDYSTAKKNAEYCAAFLNAYRLAKHPDNELRGAEWATIAVNKLYALKDYAKVIVYGRYFLSHFQKSFQKNSLDSQHLRFLVLQAVFAISQNFGPELASDVWVSFALGIHTNDSHYSSDYNLQGFLDDFPDSSYFTQVTAMRKSAISLYLATQLAAARSNARTYAEFWGAAEIVRRALDVPGALASERCSEVLGKYVEYLQALASAIEKTPAQSPWSWHKWTDIKIWQVGWNDKRLFEAAGGPPNQHPDRARMAQILRQKALAPGKQCLSN